MTTSLVVKKVPREEPTNVIRLKVNVTEIESVKQAAMDQIRAFSILIANVFVRISEVIVMGTLINVYQQEGNVKKIAQGHVL
jgi:hypothetical protein